MSKSKLYNKFKFNYCYYFVLYKLVALVLPRKYVISVCTIMYIEYNILNIGIDGKLWNTVKKGNNYFLMYRSLCPERLQWLKCKVTDSYLFLYVIVIIQLQLAIVYNIQYMHSMYYTYLFYNCHYLYYSLNNIYIPIYYWKSCKN